MSTSDPIDEKVRWALMRRLIEVLGEEEADTLMESLPPVVWRQLATKDDLALLEKSIRAEFALQMARLTRTLVFTFIGISVAMLGAFVAIVYNAPT